MKLYTVKIVFEDTEDAEFVEAPTIIDAIDAVMQIRKVSIDDIEEVQLAAPGVIRATTIREI